MNRLPLKRRRTIVPVQHRVNPRFAPGAAPLWDEEGGVFTQESTPAICSVVERSFSSEFFHNTFCFYWYIQIAC
jgi:hypothetical protein